MNYKLNKSQYKNKKKESVIQTHKKESKHKIDVNNIETIDGCYVLWYLFNTHMGHLVYSILIWFIWLVIMVIV